MARKSRKNTVTETVLPILVPELQAQINTGVYARLSVEKDEDTSIHTQVMMLHNYVAVHPELKLVDTYIDNGYTGTNFDRPDFIRMMDDVRAGKIQCIIVKDLSRFGRDFLETGYYIETLLPKLNVRLISINDNFDSTREEDVNSIALPIKNLVNEMYAKDFSRKLTAYHDLHRRNGDVKLLRSVYGYSIDKERNIFVPNPDTAPIVRMIFRWYLMGYSSGRIANQLNMLGIMTPLKYKLTVEKNQELEKEDYWNQSRVTDILRNTRYVGDLVWGKRRTILYKNVPEHKTPKEEWCVWHNMHEPIVNKDDFDLVQEMLTELASKRQKDFESYTEDMRDSFSRKVFCAECGKRMYFQQLKHENRSGAVYMCKQDDADGHRQIVHADFLKMFVADQIQLLINSMCNRKEVILAAQRQSKQASALRRDDRKAEKLKIQLGQVEDQFTTLYENLSEGTISTEEYKELKDHYQKEKLRLKAEIEQAEQDQRNADMQVARFLEWETKLEEHLGETAFNSELAKELIEKITISKKGSIEIQYSCNDVFAAVTALLDEGEEL